MTEEIKETQIQTEATAPVVEPVQEVQVSEQEVAEIKEEINKVEDSKLEEAKAEGVQEGKTIAELKAELEATKAENARIAQEQKEAEERIKLEKELAEEKAKLEQPVKKHYVAPSDNPVTAQPQAQPEIKLSKEEEWAMFEQAFSKPQSATIPLDR